MRNVNVIKSLKIFLASLFVSACAVGPDYVQPTVEVPVVYKEAADGWKIAQPQDECDRGAWWEIFNDHQLNKLEEQVNSANQTIAGAQAQYRQAQALVDEARAGYAPTLTGAAAVARQKQSSLATSSTAAVLIPRAPYTNYSASLSAAWEPDLWGSVSRLVEANEAGAQASAAQLAGVRLAAQASLAQFYFQLRALDAMQKLLDDNVVASEKLLALTQNRYKSGVVSQLDVAQAQSQYQTAQVQAIDNGVSRAQYEHAIAVLIGQPPAIFSLGRAPLTEMPPEIPLQVPSSLLERRPDVAQAERLMAQANAEIGIAVSAFFPALTLAATGGFSSNTFGNWLTVPAQVWSVGPQLAATLFDGGLRSAKTEAAYATYDQSVAAYRQTVLTAFQDVEDNLASLRILASEVAMQNEAVASAKLALKLVINAYKAGIVPYANVLTAQITAYAAEENAVSITGRRMVAAVGLVKALGGGWANGEIR
jgi:NodT family efflux transporter outer membrane factor (OMF) lipoprotein